MICECEKALIVLLTRIQFINWPKLKVPITENFIFSYLKLYLIKITSGKNFAISTKRDFLTNFWSPHFCGTPAPLITQTSRLIYDVMWRKLRNSHYLSFTSCTQKRSITSKDWITMSSQEESFSETEKPTRTFNVFLSIKSRVP